MLRSSTMERLTTVFTFRKMSSAKLPYMVSHLVPRFHAWLHLEYPATQKVCSKVQPEFLLVHDLAATKNVAPSLYGLALGMRFE